MAHLVHQIEGCVDPKNEGEVMEKRIILPRPGNLIPVDQPVVGQFTDSAIPAQLNEPLPPILIQNSV
jgi:hypothetical protein